MKDKSKNTIWEELRKTGLLLEISDERIINEPINFYCGMNVSKTENEPIDQIQFFIIAKRIQDWNLKNFGVKGQFIIFIGGLFEVLNATNLEEVELIIKQNVIKEQKKKSLFLKIIQKYNLNAKVLLTQDLWKNELYWNILKGLIDKQEFTRGLLMIDTLKFYNSKEQLFKTIKVKDLPKELVNFSLEFIKKIGNWPAPLIYTPAEVAESITLNILEGVTLKIGQAQERVYDKYLIGKMATVRLKQSTALNSSRKKPITVTPYIDNEKQKEEIRMFFSDEKEMLLQKIVQSNFENYVYAIDPDFGQILNPLIEKLIYAIESGLCMGYRDIKLFGKEVTCGQDIIELSLSNKVSLEEVSMKIVGFIDEYILKLTQ